jgi:hypothetical protein
MSIGEARARPAPKLVAVGPGLTIMKSIPKGAFFLSSGFDGAFDSFGCVIQAEGRVTVRLKLGPAWSDWETVLPPILLVRVPCRSLFGLFVP